MSSKLIIALVFVSLAIIISIAWHIDDLNNNRSRYIPVDEPDYPVVELEPSVDPGLPSVMTESEAKAIAESSCIKGGEALGIGVYNEITKTWWFDANLNTAKKGCNPACVVSEAAKNAEINWRCTGAIPSGSGGWITDFEECVAAGNPILKSNPAQCVANGQIFIEQVEKYTVCSAESRKADACDDIFNPVCATVEIQCVKAPCNPVKQTFSNACEACVNPLVKNYAAGECTK